MLGSVVVLFFLFLLYFARAQKHHQQRQQQAHNTVVHHTTDHRPEANSLSVIILNYRSGIVFVPPPALVDH